ncbi:TetR/AcrR family transcriptional regulator [Streptomyces beijiangensis]|uniref:TetR/AcrR family transcriptional regulator C-terminal domain-containing protein n=1 Tax=Streptomyces beijiangensis TaxID=163361 RepID=A0A939FC42_9ACTN|nr:TetR/AcrR family transcriptional regulator C-terminal domain-containing protein [Streptomyces beijiangensis]MBO0515486.1 TetR/AcrR family transcriptional regulator C-terminal domain-containing protein [Streptomyces beijiangensis]
MAAAVRTSVWLDGKTARSRKADQPAGGLDREKITDATVRLLDSEGLAKFSMRRLAAALGVTAMSVYWYVDTKDDLLELALDQVMGELDLPDESVDAWRDEIRHLAVSYRKVLVGHPWISPLVGEFLNVGPHATAFSAAVLNVMTRTGLPPHGQAGGIASVFQFVYGFGTVEGHFRDRCARAGMTQDEYFRHAMSAVSRNADTKANIERSRAMMEARGGETVEDMRDRDFEFALELLIAGIEAMREHTS